MATIEKISRECIECDQCGKSNPPNKCSRCHTTFYCDKTCQRKNWKEHKPYCLPIEDMKRRVAGVGSLESGVSVMSTSYRTDQPCPICLSETIEKPVVLPDCGHTFCFACLLVYQKFGTISMKFSASSDRRSSQCPYCRTQMGDIVDGLLERAHFYAARASRCGYAEEQRLMYEKALAELEPLGDSDIQGLFTKAEILISLNRPEEAFSTLEVMLRKAKEATKNAEKIEELMNRGERLRDEGRLDESEALLDVIEDMIAKQGVKRLGGDGPNKYFCIYLLMAQAKMSEKKWDEAIQILENKILPYFASESLQATGSSQEQRAMWLSLCRCWYEIKSYEKAISAGSLAAGMNRLYPGTHEYIARSHLALGNIEDAKKTMQRAIIYETPWDEEHQESVKKLYLSMFDGEES